MLSLQDAENLSPRALRSLYSDYVNPRQVRVFGKLAISRDVVDSANGAWINLRSGSRVLDLTGGIGVLSHGHNNAGILGVRRDFARKERMEVYKNYLSPYTAVLAHNIAQVLPGDLQFSYFPNSGAEAVEGALKLAYKFHNGVRDLVLVSDIGFHGKLLGAGSLTKSQEQVFKFPQIAGVETAVYGDIENWRKRFSELVGSRGQSRIYAVVIEPLSASSMKEVDAEFLRELRNLCDHYGAILIFDEVYTGWGRTGYLFNFMKVEGLVPDIVCYAKALGGGKASISGFTARTGIYLKAYDTSVDDATLHSTTYFGFGEETVTAIEAVRQVVEEDYARKAQEIGRSFSSGIRNKVGKSIWFDELRTFGALSGLIPSPNLFELALETIQKLGVKVSGVSNQSLAQRLVSLSGSEFLYRKHKILTYVGFNVGAPLKLSFPLISGEEEIKTAIEGVEELLNRKQGHLLLELARIGSRYGR